jgi:hypothetical protein
MKTTSASIHHPAPRKAMDFLLVMATAERNRHVSIGSSANRNEAMKMAIAQDKTFERRKSTSSGPSTEALIQFRRLIPKA